MVAAKNAGMDAAGIAQVSMVGEQLRVAQAGPSAQAVAVRVDGAVAPLQASIEAAETIDREQAQREALARQQAPQPDGPDGPDKGGRSR